MKNTLLACLAFLVIICIQVNAQTLNKLWEVTGLEAPESVIFDEKQDMYYVANVTGDPTQKDGSGFISQIDKNGKVVNQKWITGLDAPKGMGIHNGKLYVSDIDQVAVINISTGNIEKKYSAPGATFLNDLAIAGNGDVYVSDTFINAIYKISGDKIEQWLADEKLDFPNGLFAKGNEIFVASWGQVASDETPNAVKGKLFKISLKDRKITEISSPFANGDGLAAYKNGFIVSDWIAGKIFFVDNKGSHKEIGSYNAGTADLALAGNVLLIPQMSEGKLLAFSLK